MKRRDRFLTAWADFATGRPRLVLVCAVLLAMAGIAITLNSLEFRSDRDELVDQSLGWQQRYLEFKRQFPRWDDAVVVIERPNSGGDDLRNAFIDALSSRLRATGEFSAVTDGFPTDEAPAGLLLGQSLERVRAVADDLRRSSPIIGAATPGQLLSLTLLTSDLGDEASAELLDLLHRSHRAAVGDPPADGVLGASPPIQRLTTTNGDLAFVLVSLREQGQSTTRDAKALESKIDTLREQVMAVQSLPEFQDINAGVTGIPVLEADEARQSIADASRSTAIAFALIAILLITVYRGVATPLLALGALLLGVAWTFGYLTLAIGHLQLLSIVFAVILLGLGVDTAIHMIARLELTHPDHDHMPPAVARTFRSVGPGVLTSSLTTGAAFAATALTDFKGVAEMGIIAAGGVLLCTISVMTCFPAGLELLPHPERGLRARHGGEAQPFAGGALNVIDRKAPWVVAVGVIITALAVWYGAGVQYDADILALMPEDVESVQWANKLESEDDRSVWHAVVVADDLAEAESLTRELRDLELVSDVGDVGMLFPAELDAKRDVLQGLPDPDAVDPNPNEVDVRDIAARLADRWDTSNPELATAARQLADLTDDEATRLEQAYASDRAALIDQFRTLREAQPPSPEDLPPALQSLWFGQDGESLLRVYPSRNGSDASVLSPERLTPFANAVLAVAPSATGPTVQIYESTRLIGRAYVMSAIYAAIVIFAILLIDFRNVGDALSALAPVLIAAALLAATLRLIGVSLNFANMIVLPLIAGLGVSAGVHATHRWRQQPLDVPAGLVGGAGRAVTLTILTTVIGFGCMMIAEHRGIRSLGFVMSIGLSLVWVATVLMLPAILRLRTTLKQVKS